MLYNPYRLLSQQWKTKWNSTSVSYYTWRGILKRPIFLDIRFLVHSMQIKNRHLFLWLPDTSVWTGGLNTVFWIILHMHRHGKWWEATKFLRVKTFTFKVNQIKKVYCWQILLKSDTCHLQSRHNAREFPSYFNTRQPPLLNCVITYSQTAWLVCRLHWRNWGLFQSVTSIRTTTDYQKHKIGILFLVH